jgi:peroxiredoxin
VKALGLTFPVAADNTWSTVQAYGVGTHFQRFTSISVLIDADGVIRFVHDGGEYHPGGGPEHRECNAAYATLEAAIAGLL